METIDSTRSSTQQVRPASRTRYPWFRKSKSETDKESWHRGRAVSSGGVTASSHAASLSSSTSSTAASGVHHRADTMSSSSSHEITTSTRATTLTSRTVKHVAVQCTLITGDCTVTSYTGCDVTTTLADETAVSSGMCVEMEAVYRGTSHQRRKAIAATDDETLLSQHQINYRYMTSLTCTPVFILLLFNCSVTASAALD